MIYLFLCLAPFLVFFSLLYCLLLFPRPPRVRAYFGLLRIASRRTYSPLLSPASSALTSPFSADSLPPSGLCSSLSSSPLPNRPASGLSHYAPSPLYAGKKKSSDRWVDVSPHRCWQLARGVRQANSIFAARQKSFFFLHSFLSFSSFQLPFFFFPSTFFLLISHLPTFTVCFCCCVCISMISLFVFISSKRRRSCKSEGKTRRETPK